MSKKNIKKVLLVASPYMGLYNDIQAGLTDLGFSVELIIQKSFPNNPYSILYRKPSVAQIGKFNEILLEYWKELLDYRNHEQLYFDYLFVINGISVHPYLFEKLKSNNNKLQIYNYIYDRIKGVYQIDHIFKYYDKIYTFDRENVREYKLNLLPIYWVPVADKAENELDIFAFGGIDPIRIDVFKRIKRVVDSTNLRCFIKVYHSEVTNSFAYTISRIGKYLLQGRKSPSLKELKSDLFTSEAMSTYAFRKYINSSSVIIDTNHPYQDGLTARFMWALGLGKKIITNNKNIVKYDFYSKEQVFILDDNTSDQDILNFIYCKVHIPQDILALANKYRIDNWLKTILNL